MEVIKPLLMLLDECEETTTAIADVVEAEGMVATKVHHL
jgi:hypothetical protein